MGRRPLGLPTDVRGDMAISLNIATTRDRPSWLSLERKHTDPVRETKSLIAVSLILTLSHLLHNALLTVLMNILNLIHMYM